MTFLMSAVLTVVNLLFYVCSMKKKKKKQRKEKKIVFSDILAVEALPYTIVAGSYSFINGIIASYLVMYADELGISGVSVYFTVCAAVLFIVRPFSGKLMDKKGIRVTVLPGLARMTASSMFILGRSTSLILILITGVLCVLSGRESHSLLCRQDALIKLEPGAVAWQQVPTILVVIFSRVLNG